MKKYCESCLEETEHRWLECAGDCQCAEETANSGDGTCERCLLCKGGADCQEIICCACGSSAA